MFISIKYILNIKQKLSVENIARREVWPQKEAKDLGPKGVFMMQLYLKYQTLTYFGSKYIAQVKVFQN
jgi:hypothetical protein